MKSNDLIFYGAVGAAALYLYRWYQQQQQQAAGLMRVNMPAPAVNPASPYATPGMPWLLPFFASTVNDNRPSLNYLDLPPGSVWNEETDGYQILDYGV